MPWLSDAGAGSLLAFKSGNCVWSVLDLSLSQDMRQFLVHVREASKEGQGGQGGPGGYW